jgi:mRNA-degrading endonuclease toxin of MazEF toxin-antitoxin module
VNPGSVWALDDGSRRMVLSNATYNESGLNRVITAVVNARQTTGFDPFAVNTEMGTIHADRIAMHPRHWLTKELGQVEDQALATVRTHLVFLLS